MMSKHRLAFRTSVIFSLMVSIGGSVGPLVKSALAHDEDFRVSIELESNPSMVAGKVSLDFQMIDLKTKNVLGEKDLVVLHERKLHLFIFDPALKEFRHEHPEFSNGMWHVSADLSVNGNYWVWAQGQLASDQEEFVAPVRLKIVGGSTENPMPPVLGDVRTGTDGSSRIEVSGGKIKANALVMLMLKFSRTDGTAPVLTPYLGSLAHVVAVASDGDSLVHVHPMSSGPTELMLHLVFGAAGDYRLWVQFVDGGVLKTVPLSVHVAP